MKLELHATPLEIMRAVEALEKFARERELPEKTIFGLTLALEECASNIVDHALQGDSQQTFQVAFTHTGTSIMVELRDRGPQFDLTTAPRREQEIRDDDQTGGWGVPLVRRYTDDIRYRREAGENVLQLIKHVAQDHAEGINNHKPNPN